jgi:hypothetical protein
LYKLKKREKKMVLKENKMFYTPKSGDELMERIEQIASGCSNPEAVWTAVMMMQNFIAVEMKAVVLMS